MKKYIPHIIIIALVVALLFSLQRCAYNKRVGTDNAVTLTDTVQHYINTLGTQSASIKTLQADKAGLKTLLLDKDAALAALAGEFAKVHTIVKAETVFKADTITVAYTDTIPCDFDRSGSVLDEWYSFRYTSNQKGFKIDSLTIPNSITVITGTKRKWFLGKETLTTDITNTNPYIIVTHIKAAELTVPVPWYKKWYVWLAAGAVGGFVIAK
ncbi:MAG: hypothetical protein EOP54_30470 [Sphingobacteriales bacterium]|nr:MAG: hypothetical protein EOP54_30470 [Sphingobacteriales bacterium]